MKIYLASSFDLKEKVQQVADILEKHGHQITRKWWDKNFKEIIKIEAPEWFQHPDVVAVAKKNFSAIEAADALILVAPHDRTKKFNGANIELGYALALKKFCFSLGKLEKSAMYVPVTQVTTIEELLDHLDKIQA